MADIGQIKGTTMESLRISLEPVPETHPQYQAPKGGTYMPLYERLKERQKEFDFVSPLDIQATKKKRNRNDK